MDQPTGLHWCLFLVVLAQTVPRTLSELIMAYHGQPRCFRQGRKKKERKYWHHHPVMLMVMLCLVFGHVCCQNEDTVAKPNTDVLSTRSPLTSPTTESDVSEVPDLPVSDPVKTNSERPATATTSCRMPTAAETSPESFTTGDKDSESPKPTGKPDDTYCDWNQSSHQSMRLKNTNGHVQWSEPARSRYCIQELTWHIQSPQQNLGISLQFMHFSFKWYESLEVYRGDERTDDLLLFRYPNLTTAVLLLPYGEITVWVRVMPWPFYIVENAPSSFSFNYSMHPLHNLPVRVSNTKPMVRVSPFISENYLYNCSSTTIPDSILCDKVQQCLGGEDEPASCSYRSGRCDYPRFSLRRHCLQVIITTKNNSLQSCDQTSDGKLAVLPEPADREMLGAVISRTGVSKMCLTVDLTNAAVKLQSSQMKSQYQHVLQWGQGIMNHGDPLLSNVEKDSQFALLFSRGLVSTMPSHGAECQSSSVTGLLCMKISGSSNDQEVNNPASRFLRLSTTSNGTVLTALSLSTHSLKHCIDGSLVFQFQRCPEDSSDQLWSTGKFRMFDCLLGGHVHYSLVCDGLSDCGDGSDELDCDGSQTVRLPESFFFCGDGQILLLSKRCDGVPDCLDQSDEQTCTTCAKGKVLCRGLGCRPSSYKYFFGCDTSLTVSASGRHVSESPSYTDLVMVLHRNMVKDFRSTDFPTQLISIYSSYLTMSPRHSLRTGMVMFGSQVEVVFNLRAWDRTTMGDIITASNNAFYRPSSLGEGTNTAGALNVSRTMFSKADRRAGSSRVIVLMLGALSDNTDDTIREAEEAKAQGIHILAVGLGIKDAQELRRIASQPLQENIFLRDSLDGVLEALYRVLFCLFPTTQPDRSPLVDADKSALPNVAKGKSAMPIISKEDAQCPVDGKNHRCTVTGDLSRQWIVELLGLYEVHVVTISAFIYDKEYPYTHYDISVAVSWTTPTTSQQSYQNTSDHCAHHVGETPTDGGFLSLHLKCLRPMKGRHVALTSSNFQPLFPLSEVEVYGIPLLEKWGRAPYSYPPAVLDMDGLGASTTRALEEGPDSCPETHFPCPRGFCIPTQLLMNGLTDCPQGHDEQIENLACPGFFRCRQSGNCLHPNYVCDGVYHCPFNDDELYCDAKQCPQGCLCEGLAFYCRSGIDYQMHYELRYLSYAGTANPDLKHIEALSYLRYLNLSNCELKNVTFGSLSQLRILDLSFNDIKSFELLELTFLPELVHLNLSYNPLADTFNFTFSTFVKKAGFVKLKSLEIAGIGLEMIANKALHRLKALFALDLRDNPLSTLRGDVFGKSLQVLYSDNPKWCCSHFRLSQDIECHAPVDELSSCADLLKSDFLRVLLWLLTMMALTGNVGVLVYRSIIEKQGTSLAYKILVINLSTADLLMGVYMVIIGVADVIFRGDYVLREEGWRHSVTCKIAGFLALLSSEMSAFVMSLITLDRFVLLRFPYNSHLHPSKRTAFLACCIAWLMAITLAALPFFMPDWEFYSQNSICLPLPIVRQDFLGQQYAFGIFIVLNFIIFLIIAAGQTVIYYTIRQSSRTLQKDNQKKDIAITRRLFLIVFTDFCCWFPIGLLGLMSARGARISGVVNVWAAIFVLPLNSAINPFLYTLNTFLERRTKHKETKQTARILNELKTDMRAWSKDKVVDVIGMWLTVGSVSKKALQEMTDYYPIRKEDILEFVETYLSATALREEEAKELVHRWLGSITQGKENGQHQKDLSDKPYSSLSSESDIQQYSADSQVSHIGKSKS